MVAPALQDIWPPWRELSQYCGVLEPLQSAQSLVGQIEELHGHYPWIEKAARKPFFEILLKEINNS